MGRQKSYAGMLTVLRVAQGCSGLLRVAQASLASPAAAEGN